MEQMLTIIVKFFVSTRLNQQQPKSMPLSTRHGAVIRVQRATNATLIPLATGAIFQVMGCGWWNGHFLDWIGWSSAAFAMNRGDQEQAAGGQGTVKISIPSVTRFPCCQG
jgi:hypothetical protein